MSGVLNDYPPNYNENMEMAEIEKPIEESDGRDGQVQYTVRKKR